MNRITIATLTTAIVLSASAVFPESKVATDVARIHEKFVEVATKVQKDLLKKIPAAKKRQMLEELKITERDAPRVLASMLVDDHPALKVTDKEARALVARRFQDRQNRDRVRSASKFLSELRVELPHLTTYLIDKVEKSSDFRAGIELEFAARILSHQVVLVRNALEKQKQK